MEIRDNGQNLRHKETGMVGDSTKSEIAYAKVHGKDIEYLEPIK